MEKSKTRVLLQVVNIALILITGVVLLVMRFHNTLYSDVLNEDLIEIGLPWGYYLFFNPWMRWVYIFIFIAIIGKEFLFRNRMKTRLATNIISAVFFSLLLVFQFMAVPIFMEYIVH